VAPWWPGGLPFGRSLCLKSASSRGGTKVLFLLTASTLVWASDIRQTLLGHFRFLTMTPPKFAHRDNPDGSRDSICLNCHITALQGLFVRSDEDLKAIEAHHVCDPLRLAALATVRRSSTIDAPRIASHIFPRRSKLHVMGRVTLAPHKAEPRHSSSE
jgi:hypothetical protein